MRILALLVLATLASFGAPAFGQEVMKDFSWNDMRAELTGAGAEITREDIADEQRYLSAKDDTGLVFAVYGFECDNKEITQRCTGADFIASFTLKDPATVNDVLDDIDYAALGDYKGDDGKFKVSRYVIFDNGITRGNLRTNIEVFMRISNEIWDTLDDKELLK